MILGGMQRERAYWWVNQSGTFHHEVGGNFIWSPKVERDGKRNQSYDFMTEVCPGDVVFSYAKTLIRAVGIAQSPSYFFPRPAEFGKSGVVWNDSGWRVDVAFEQLVAPISPRARLPDVVPLLPKKYSPINAKGFGQQKIYLARISRELAALLAESLSPTLRAAIELGNAADADWELRQKPDGTRQWEEIEESRIREDIAIPETTREALIQARVGQGRFKKNVRETEQCCRVTLVKNAAFLIASHIKPWRACTNEERLDGANGLLLTPTVDYLFDKGYISFADDGSLLIAAAADRAALERMGIAAGAVTALPFTDRQRKYLEFHRNQIFIRGVTSPAGVR